MYATSVRRVAPGTRSSPGHGHAELRSARSRAKWAREVLRTKSVREVGEERARPERFEESTDLEGRAQRRDSDLWPSDGPRRKAEGVPVGGFPKRARGGDPRLSGAKERSEGLRPSERSRRRESPPADRLRSQRGHHFDRRGRFDRVDFFELFGRTVFFALFDRADLAARGDFARRSDDA